jgi:phosphoglycolate phosphatase-like HAD superfamily hydrolase
MSGAALILFDIDGTLVLTGGAGMRAMDRAFTSVFGVEQAFAGVNAGGRTDSFLVSQALAAAGLPDTPDRHERFKTAYLPLLAEEVLQPGKGRKGMMPGVPQLIAAARRHAALHLALLTGNYRGAAEIKLSHFGLWDAFAFGAFSDDSGDRNALVPIACERARAHGVPPDACGRVIVIGDTPHDIECAAAAGVTSLAVATGGFTRTELEAAGADIVLDDLSETAAVLRLLL